MFISIVLGSIFDKFNLVHAVHWALFLFGDWSMHAWHARESIIASDLCSSRLRDSSISPVLALECRNSQLVTTVPLAWSIKLARPACMHALNNKSTSSRLVL